ncbi:MAG: right-handed parallel beta-helix repeat-containing protein [Oscillospiraceae bacterium]|nr:right-handed parallel beta-helix repeat-containing protein [Oscillospiraceae bacterium]
MKTYYVAKTGCDTNPGTKDLPFLTINAAAEVARAGDAVVVHEGEYREWVKPHEGGHSNARRITYAAADGERVVIKGSERIQSWEQVKSCDTVWKAVLPNSFFNGYNPYREIVVGDWLLEPQGRSAHLGDVYLNGMSFYEAESAEHVFRPKIRTETLDHWTKKMTPIKNTNQTKYLWFGTVDAENTTIIANFHGADPNKELVEINVRKCCFYPEKTGINYITVRGFEMAQAACPWTPPTADQPGLIGAHWSRGWIIEDNIIHDAKCSAVSIGKEISTGHNDRTFRKDRPGYQYQLEAVFKARKIGWSKEKIGSHIIRNNVIYDCGQNGIVGHLGCVFSEIYGNHIYNIAVRREFYGHEIAGIKLHAPIDVQIRNNHIHDCSLGIWMDWQAQGTRISKNLLYDNNRDLFMEVSHGPSLIDYNIFGSAYALHNDAQGMAYVHNLFAGKFALHFSTDRATPYHVPHSTEVAGFSAIFGGDDRYYQNIFIGGRTDDMVGLAGFAGHTVSLDEYMDIVDSRQPCDHTEFMSVKQPVYASGNVYFGGAVGLERENDKLDFGEFDAGFAIEKAAAVCCREKDSITDDGMGDFREGDSRDNNCADGEHAVFLNITLPESFDLYRSAAHTTRSLGRARIVDADYEMPDGRPLVLDVDYLGNGVDDVSVAGPVSTLKPGKNRVRVW